MPAQQESWIATAYLESGTIARGQVGCLNAAGTAYVVASAANRTAAGRRSACIALSNGDADNPSGAGFEAQYVGVVPPSISGLGTGTASSIRVSSAGILERATFDSADDVCGRCDTDGTAYVCFPLIGLAAAFGSFTLPTPNYGIIYRGTDGLPKTATHASIDATGGYIEHGADRTGGAATTGDDRYARYGSARVRNRNNSNDLCVWEHASVSSTTFDGLSIGGLGGDSSDAANRTFNAVAISAKNSIGMQAGFVSSVAASGLVAFAPGVVGATGAGATARFGFSHPNFVVGPASLLASLSFDPAKGAKGIIALRRITTNPIAAPDQGWLLRANSSTDHPEVLLPGDDPSTGWRDLLGSGKCLVVFTGSAVANTTTFLNAYGIPQATEAGFTIRSICVTADAVASAGTYSVQVTVNGTAISPALAFVVTTGTSSGQAALATPYAIGAGDAIGVKVVGSSNSEAPNLGFNVTVCLGSSGS